MKLRLLEDKMYMFEWMKDSRVNRFFKFDGNNVDIEMVTKFINNSLEDKNNYHFAIVYDNDEYKGTVSLKNVDFNASKAEYAIAIRYDFSR